MTDSIPETLQRAIQHHQAGRLPDAEALYREVLARDSSSADAWHLLGVSAHQAGRHDVAVQLIGHAAALAPDQADIQSNLGEACRHLGRLDRAVTQFQRALALQSDFPDALNNLGNAFAAQRRFDDALACFQRAISLRPNSAKSHYNLGNLYKQRLQPDDAIACYRQALALNSDFADVHNNLGTLYNVRGQLGEALAHLRRAVTLNPNLAEAHNNLGNALRECGQIDGALHCFQRALTLDPDFAAAHNNLGNLYKDCRELDRTQACYQRALELAPDRADYRSNLIFALQNRSDPDSGALDLELQRWSDRHARPLARLIQPHVNDRAPDRPLRVGYLSHDFKLHSVAFFLVALLEAHDHGQFHLTGYSSNPRADEVTARLRACTDQWRSLVGLSDDAAAQAIRDDRIDLLVDLSGHTAGNRLLVFARKPAPIQVSYLGFPGGTGLATIDCRLTDPWADPPGASDGPPADPVVRLPETAWCFTPLSGQPPVGALPALRHGYVTFGCFNNFAKVTDEMLELWAQILHRVPHARLALKSSALGSPSIIQRLQTFFNQRGLAPARLELIPAQASIAEHLQCYDRVDLALDTFPYHGTTTTCEALWMGVPVVTLAGHRHVARVGVSLLTNVGLPEFVATSPAAYLDTAVAAACDLPRLAALRAGLRERMQCSPLMDAPRFARQVEVAYRTLWRRWCAQPASISRPTP